jgi:spore maturation protein CgeB
MERVKKGLRGSSRSIRGSGRSSRGSNSRGSRSSRSRLSRLGESNTTSAGFRQGWSIGYPLGNSYGNHLGNCEAIIGRHRVQVPLPRRQLKLLFVVSGQGDPYATIERGLLASLHELVELLRVVTPFDDIISVAEQIKPDLVIVFNGLNYVAATTVQQLRKRGMRTAVWFTDDPYYADLSGAIALNYDIVFTQELSCVDWYRSLGCMEVHYMPLAASMEIYRPQRVDGQLHTDICFLGSGYRNRIALFDAIAPLLASHKTLIVGRWWERLEQYKLLKPFIRDEEAWLTAEDTNYRYASARIVINCHRAYDDDEINSNQLRIQALSPNPRTFEIAAAGALQLVDARADLARFYMSGQEVETFSSSGELADKINYYLQHEGQRKQIALKGLARTVREHTYISRLQELLRAAFGS